MHQYDIHNFSVFIMKFSSGSNKQTAVKSDTGNSGTA